MADFQLQVYTQEKKVYDDPVTSIIVPAATGYLGVLANHAPLVALLGEGWLTVRPVGGADMRYHISGGFLEVRNNVATLLVDSMDEGTELPAA